MDDSVSRRMVRLFVRSSIYTAQPVLTNSKVLKVFQVKTDSHSKRPEAQSVQNTVLNLKASQICSKY